MWASKRKPLIRYLRCSPVRSASNGAAAGRQAAVVPTAIHTGHITTGFGGKAVGSENSTSSGLTWKAFAPDAKPAGNSVARCETLLTNGGRSPKRSADWRHNARPSPSISTQPATRPGG